jgi:hypothetical protein
MYFWELIRELTFCVYVKDKIRDQMCALCDYAAPYIINHIMTIFRCSFCDEICHFLSHIYLKSHQGI